MPVVLDVPRFDMLNSFSVHLLDGKIQCFQYFFWVPLFLLFEPFDSLDKRIEPIIQVVFHLVFVETFLGVYCPLSSLLARTVPSEF